MANAGAVQLAQGQLGGAEIGEVAMGFCQMQRDAVDEAATSAAVRPRAASGRRRDRAPAPARGVRGRTDDGRADRTSGTWSSRRSTASTSPASSRKRPRSTVENTSRFSSTPSVQRADRMAASSLGKLMVLRRRRYAKMIGDPAIEIGKRPGAERLLFGDRLLVAAQPRAIRLFGRQAGKRREQPKLMFIGWNERVPASMVSIWPPVIWPSSEPSAVVTGGGSSDCARAFAAA